MPRRGPDARRVAAQSCTRSVHFPSLAQAATLHPAAPLAAARRNVHARVGSFDVGGSTVRFAPVKLGVLLLPDLEVSMLRALVHLLDNNDNCDGERNDERTEYGGEAQRDDADGVNCAIGSSSSPFHRDERELTPTPRGGYN